MPLETIPMTQPTATQVLSPDGALAGPSIPPVVRMQTWSADEWELFIQEYANALKGEYHDVHRCGGAGDKGRDVIAYQTDDVAGEWDNYQCKHYARALAPSDIWIELGKLCYYTLTDEYTLPRRYYLVAPRGIGPLLSQLLAKPTKLRDGLLDNWEDKVRCQISDSFSVPLTSRMRSHVESVDFKIVQSISPIKLVEKHASTRWHTLRFGGGLPPRPPMEEPPTEHGEHERKYIQALFAAYSERTGQNVSDVSELADEILRNHFSRSRTEFYSAEFLKAYSRDNVPPGTFESLLEELLSGIADTVDSDFANGFERVKEVVKVARSLQITGNALVPRMDNRDRGGMCHQLANEDKVKWVKES